MTQDFRQPSGQSGPTVTTSAGPGLAAPQKLVLRMLTLSGLGFVLAALAVLVFEPAFLPAEIQPFLIIAFILAAISDAFAVWLMRRVWSRSSRG